MRSASAWVQRGWPNGGHGRRDGLHACFWQWPASSAPAVLASLLGADLYGGWWTLATYTLCALMAVLVIYALGGRTATSRLGGLFLATAVWVGRRAYGLYVFHWFAIKLVLWLRHPGAENVYNGVDAAFSVLLTVALAALSYRLWEEPFLRMKERFEVVHSQPDSALPPPHAAMRNAPSPPPDIPRSVRGAPRVSLDARQFRMAGRLISRRGIARLFGQDA